MRRRPVDELVLSHRRRRSEDDTFRLIGESNGHNESSA